jgi:hypothetical protein
VREVTADTPTREESVDRGVEGPAAAQHVAEAAMHPRPDGATAFGTLGQPAQLHRPERLERVGRAVAALSQRDQGLGDTGATGFRGRAFQRGAVPDVEPTRPAPHDVHPVPVIDRHLVGGDRPAVERDNELLGLDRAGRGRHGDLEGHRHVVDDLEGELGSDLRAPGVGRSSDGTTVTDPAPRGKRRWHCRRARNNVVAQALP